MLPTDVVKSWPKLKADGGKKTSEATNRYNCIAWSFERAQENWYEPKPTQPWEVWPKGIPDDYSLESFIILFQKKGYKKCEKDFSFEFFYKKVAIYAAFGIYNQPQWEFTHVSDQLHSGVWTSKLGKNIDIQHNTPSSLEGNDADEYGEVFQILKRSCRPWELLAKIYFKIKSLF